MIELDGQRIAAEAGARVVREGSGEHPRRAIADSREAGPGDIFFGLVGERANGGAFAGEVLEAGAWGVIVGPEHAQQAVDGSAAGWILASEDPLRSLGYLARAWRRELRCEVVGITGSTGKTSVKDIAAGLLPGRVHATPGNYNTEVGLPLGILSAPVGTDALVLEMSMRAPGEIALLCEIAEPDVGAITNVGPVHLELLGSIEAIAAAKAEILAGLAEDGRAVVPAEPGALAPHLTGERRTLSFGAGGDVYAGEVDLQDGVADVFVITPAGRQRFRFPFTESHNLLNALCAVAIGVALDTPLAALSERAPGIVLSPLRGEQVLLADGVVVINDSYNANPVSMRAALENLRSLEASGRRVAVLGDMYELGPDQAEFHREVGEHARELGIDAILGVGELARDYAPDEWAPSAEAAVELAGDLIAPGDIVLVKGSRGVGLERFAEQLAASRGRAEG